MTIRRAIRQDGALARREDQPPVVPDRFSRWFLAERQLPRDCAVGGMSRRQIPRFDDEDETVTEGRLELGMRRDQPSLSSGLDAVCHQTIALDWEEGQPASVGRWSDETIVQRERPHRTNRKQRKGRTLQGSQRLFTDLGNRRRRWFGGLRRGRLGSGRLGSGRLRGNCDRARRQ